MNSRMMDYVSPIEKQTNTVRENCPNVLDPGFVIENCNDGFCDKDMSLTFRDNRLYNSSLLPEDTSKESATTHAMITTSLSFTEHKEVVYHIKDEALAKLYHIVDNPEVVFDSISGQYVAARHHYIDRETMTGIVIHDKLEYGYYGVIGIFAPRGYSKIDSYNAFAQKYLTLINRDTINSNVM